MKTAGISMGSALAGAVLVAAALLVAWAAVGGRQLPWLTSVRASAIAVVVLGMTACAVGGIGAGLARASGQWTSPWIVAGCVLGVIALVAAITAVSGLRLPLLASTEASLVVLAVVIAAKFALTTAQTVAALAQRG